MVPGTRADLAEADWVSDELGNEPHVTLGCGHLVRPGSGPLAEAGYGYCRYHGRDPYRALRCGARDARRGGRPVTGPADFTGYALYREAMDAFGDPVFAAWLCRGYPWGGVDLNRAHEGFLLARDGVRMTGGDARTVLNLLVREVTTLEHRIDHEGQAAVLGPAARALRRLMTDIRRLANAHPAGAGFRLRCPCSAGDGEFAGAHEDSLPQADPPAVLTLRSAAKKIAGARNTPAALDRNKALDDALGLVRLALYQLGSAEGAEGEVTSTEGEPA